MVIPNLPTDNLYKFIALSGLTIFVIIIISLSISYNKLQDETDLIETEIDEYLYITSKLKDKSERTKLDIKSAKSQMEKYEMAKLVDLHLDIDELFQRFHNPEQREYYQFIYNNKKDITPEITIVEEIEVELKKLEKLYEDINLNLFQTKRKEELLLLKKERMRWYLSFYIFGIIVSFLTCILGFYLWYFRVQRYLDDKLKAEVTLNNK